MAPIPFCGMSWRARCYRSVLSAVVIGRASSFLDLRLAMEGGTDGHLLSADSPDAEPASVAVAATEPSWRKRRRDTIHPPRRPIIASEGRACRRVGTVTRCASSETVTRSRTCVTRRSADDELGWRTDGVPQ